MSATELGQLVDSLADDAIVKRSVNAIADGTASGALRSATMTMLKAKAYNFLGRYLTDDEFEAVAKALGDRVITLFPATQGGSGR